MRGRDWRFRLADIEDYAGRALTYTHGLGYEQFRSDQMRVDAVLRALHVIGEAARFVPDDVRRRLPGIPWTEIIGMRNLIAHAYLRVDLQVVWDTVHRDLPTLLEALGRFRDVEERGGP